MRSFYEDLWESLPETLAPPELDLRRAFLQSGIAAGERVLDLGCGAGELTAAILAAGARATGADVAEAALARARRAAPGAEFALVPCDGPLPFADGAFEAVWASEVLEHVADTAAWLTEVHRVLATGGRLLITTPNHPRLGLLIRGLEAYAEPLSDHLHLYTARSLQATLAALGFTEVEIRTAAGPPLLRRLLLTRAVRG